MKKETTDMMFYSTWQSSAQVRLELGQLPNCEYKEEALKTQLIFIKMVSNKSVKIKMYTHSVKK